MAIPPNRASHTYRQGQPGQPSGAQTGLPPVAPPETRPAGIDTAELTRPLPHKQELRRFQALRARFSKGLTTTHQSRWSKPGLSLIDAALTGSWALAMAALALGNPNLVQRLERQAQTAFFELGGPQPVPEDIVILAIDDSSLNAGEFFVQDPQAYAALEPIQAWPWKRQAYGQAIARLMEAGARAVSVDIILSVPSSYGPEDDRALAATLAQYPGQIVLAEQFSDDVSDQGDIVQYERPLQEFLATQAQPGLINFIQEPDGRIHRLGSQALRQKRLEDPLFEALDSDRLGRDGTSLGRSFAAATLAAAQVDYPPPQGTSIFFHGPTQTFQHIPFWKVLDDQGWASLQDSGFSFEDKIVLIGATASILQDLHWVPFGRTLQYPQPMAGVEVQANAIATLWQDKAIQDWSEAPWQRSGLTFAVILLASWLMSRPRQLLHRLASAGALALAWGLISFGLFAGVQLFVPVALPMLAIAGFGGGQLMVVGVREQLRKQRLRTMLKSHASVPAVREILSQQEDLQELLLEREAEVIGKLLSQRYRVVKLLGTGGFSETYIAQDTQRPGSPPCVVKQLRLLQGKTNKLLLMRRLFRTEAETLERLGLHDQIPRLLAYFEEDYEFYLVQELIVGQSLHGELLQRARLPLLGVVQLLHDLLTVLAFIHSQGIIHRDIKPNNIIRRIHDGKYTLIDFGIAKTISDSLHNDTSPQLTIAIGTQGYIPREQVAGRPVYSSDFYALGTTAIEALTGLIPRQFKYDDEGEILWAHRTDGLSPALVSFLTRLVRSDVAQRYGSAQAALADLTQLPEFQALERGEYLPSSAAALPALGEEPAEAEAAIAETKLWIRDDPC